MGRDRSLRELSQITGVHASVLGRYRNQYGWARAAEEYDLEVVRRAMEQDQSHKAEEWRKRQEQQLKVATILRKKFLDYVLPRELEAVEDDKGRVVVPGMDPMKAAVALNFAKEANAIERAVLGITEITVTHQDGVVITAEAMQLAVQKAAQKRLEWRVESGMPAIEDDDPLGEYAL